MKVILMSLRLCVLALLAFGVQAQTLSDLYQVKLAAAQSAEQTTPPQAVIEKGLEQVLVKVTGQAEPVKLDIVREQAAQLLEEARLIDGYWQLSFRTATLNALLAQADVKRIAADRPRVLVWLGQPGAAGVQDFAADHNSIWPALQQRASYRGLPLARPLLDLQDQQLDPQQLWQFAREPVLAASRRYQADAVLVGVEQQERIFWQLLTSSQTYRLSDTAKNPQAYAAVLDFVADKLLPAAGVQAFEYQRMGVSVEISGVNNLQDYRTILDQIKQSPALGEPAVADVVQDRLHIYIRAAQDINLLTELQKIRGLSAEPRLSGAGLSLRWVRPLPPVEPAVTDLQNSAEQDAVLAAEKTLTPEPEA